jgi:hypothetical protein
MLKKMDTRFIIGLLLVSVLLLPLCTEKTETPLEKTITTVPDETTVTSASEKQQPTTTSVEMPLSELQVEACNNAGLGGTCVSKLQELNVVPLADCCKYLGKCCV